MRTDDWLMTEAASLDGLEPAAKSEDESPARSPLLDAKVMMLDDEPLMTALIQTHLEDEGYTNFVVSNDPREAIHLLMQEAPGVLLLDLMMPQMSGFDVLELIRSDEALRFTPVIVLTAATGAASKLRALQLGATDFLSKPVDASELVLRVRNTLAFHQYHNRMAHYDAATELPNGRLFDRGIEAMLDNAGSVGGMPALFSVSVPDCRLLREGIGQSTADELTRVLARRLRHFAERENPPSALATPADRAPRVARLAPDQFGVMLEGLRDGEAIDAAAKRLVQSVVEPVPLGLHEVVPATWIGIAVAPGDGRDAESLRKSADLAATHARQQGALPIVFASPALNAQSYERLTLGSQLRGAAQRGELRLHYQPKVDVASGRIIGAEALVRWMHPERGLLPPARFIALAEEMGLIRGIGDWVIGQACRDAAGWARDGLGVLKVAVNVAKPQFLAGDLVSVLRQAVFDSGLAPTQLVAELTESMLMDDADKAIALMREIKALGVSLSIDDFGTGYSSLAYLKRFPLDELKIDRSFVVDLPGKASDEAIARHVIELGHSLGMNVIAEGVETGPQRDCLARLGCDQIQGFLYSRPLPPEQFVELVRRGPISATARCLPAAT